MKLKYNKTLIAVLGLAATTLSLRADLVVDRGLPIINLNNAAGANRANVAWADSETTGSPAEYYVPGDNFTITGSGTYQVDTIRLWTTGSSASLSLLGGFGDSICLISTTYTPTLITYADASSYQQLGGGFVDLYQIDFTVNLTLDAGQTYNFFLDSPFLLTNPDDYRNTTLHSSNAGVSGSPQDGAEGTFLWLHVNGVDQDVETWRTGDGTGTSGFGPGLWDKNSDANVQVFATPVPEPGSMSIIFCALLLLPFSKTLRQKLQKRA